MVFRAAQAVVSSCCRMGPNTVSAAGSSAKIFTSSLTTYMNAGCRVCNSHRLCVDKTTSMIHTPAARHGNQCCHKNQQASQQTDLLQSHMANIPSIVLLLLRVPVHATCAHKQPSPEVHWLPDRAARRAAGPHLLEACRQCLQEQGQQRAARAPRGFQAVAQRSAAVLQGAGAVGRAGHGRIQRWP